MLRITIIILLALVVAGSASADETFYATLLPRAGTGSTGSGTATLILSADASSVSYNVTVTGLSSTELAAHIHRPDGSIAHQLPLGTTKSGVWLNPGFIDVSSLRLGQLFILVHTDANPGGELRGAITDEQVSTEVTTWGRIKALY